MSPSSDFDTRLADWLDTQAPMREPDGLTYAVLARTRRMRQLPGWASLERWLPMTVITRPGLAPPLRMAWLLLIGLLMVALVASVAIVGSRLLTSTGPDGGLAATAVIPQGDEAVFALTSFRRHLHGASGRHRPASADRRAGRDVDPDLVARWDADRLPPPGGRSRLGGRHGRGRGRADDRRDAHPGHGLLRLLEPGVVARRDEPDLPDQRSL